MCLGHNATRGVFNRLRADIAKRQGVAIKSIDWRAMTPGQAWRLAEEQFSAAGIAAEVIDEYFRQFNNYRDCL